MKIEEYVRIVDRKMVPIKSAVLDMSVETDDTAATSKWDMLYTTRLQLYSQTMVSSLALMEASNPEDIVADVKKGMIKDIERTLFSDMLGDLLALERAIDYEDRYEQMAAYRKVFNRAVGR